VQGEAGLTIAAADTAAEIAACFPVMAELRTHLRDADDLVARVRRQQADGYRLVCLQREDTVVACAGYRIHEMLVHGRMLYVDDLVTSAAERGRGHGARLLAWLADAARAADCASLQLDSGQQRKAAHRFYEREGMTAAALHFVLPLPAA